MQFTLIGSGVLFGFLACLALAATLDRFESDAFCTSCHVMDGVAREWRESVHQVNASGLKAGCADCHVPPGVVWKVRSKLHALHAEVWPWLRGVDTPEELDARRTVLAEAVWEHLRVTDSAACRSCHAMSAADLDLQTPRGRAQHRDAEAEGESCIDCHDDGIAHRPIEGPGSQKEEEWDSEDFSL